jgi:hypothetical protein
MTCPNCGQEFEGNRCPNCGRPTTSTGSRIAAALVVILLVLPAGVFGACSAVVLALATTGTPDIFSLGMFLVFTLAGLGLAYWAIQWAKSLWNG